MTTTATTASTTHRWWSDGEPTGHYDYCARPTHSLSSPCSRETRPDGCLTSVPSPAWRADHPQG